MRSRRRRYMLAKTALAAEVAVVLVSASAPGALAQPEPGVIRDPDSPAGKEYALPLDAGRRAGAGSESPDREGIAPLFGIGIKPAGTGDGQGANGRSGDNASGDEARADGSTRDDRRGPVLAGASAGGDTSSVTLAILVAILLGGGLAGTALRVASRTRVRT